MATASIHKTRNIGRWLVFPFVTAVGLAAACTAPGKGALILAVNTDMQAPQDVNVVQFFIETDGVPKFDYIGRVTPQGTVSLPSTLAIVQPDKPNAQVRIRVIAFKERVPMVLRDVLTTVPEGRTALLTLPLNFLDYGSADTTTQLPTEYLPSLMPSTASDISEGVTDFNPDTIAYSDPNCDFLTLSNTSVNGKCVSASVDSTQLPDYSDDLVFGDGGTATAQNCLDVGSCFQGATPVTNLDLTTCSFPVPAAGGSTDTGGDASAFAADGGSSVGNPQTEDASISTTPCGAGSCSASQVCCVSAGDTSSAACVPNGSCKGSVLCGGLTCSTGDICCTVGGASGCATAQMCTLLQQMTGVGADAGASGGGSSSGSTGTGSTSGGAIADAGPAPLDAVVGGQSAPASLTGPSLNFALVTPTTGACITPGQCFVPIDNDSTSPPVDGWVVTGGRVQMAPAICAKLMQMQASVQLYMVNGACASKSADTPVCEETSFSGASDGGATSQDASISHADSGTSGGGSSGGGSVEAGVGARDASVDASGGFPDGGTTFGDSGTAGPTTPLTGVTAIAAGSFHTCALMSNQTVVCWGLNSNGQLGNGTTAESQTAVVVTGAGPQPTAITAGASHTCVLLASGAVQCWGNDNSGQLGNGSLKQDPVPGLVTGLPAATAIAAGADFTCALLTDGTVDCWGLNTSGQLGNGGTGQALTPVPVSGLTGATSIAAGGTFACALISGGTVECWGYDQDGELGDGVTGAPSLTPVAVSTVTSATAIAAGSLHACALLQGGTVDCWGNNADGQVGDGTMTGEPAPVGTLPLQGQAIALAGGSLHTCAVLASGTVQCWGEDSLGQVGNGSYSSYVLTPSPVALSPATAITAGQSHTCALVSSGAVECWGSNQDGQLGDPQVSQSATPVPVYTAALAP